MECVCSLVTTSQLCVVEQFMLDLGAAAMFLLYAGYIKKAVGSLAVYHEKHAGNVPCSILLMMND